MKLTEQQIEQLYSFTQNHYVEFYDVQTELVDHLANGIESALAGDPKMDFDQALNTEFKKFGVMGFSEVVEQKTNTLDKRYRKMVWKQVLEFFKLPKIFLTSFLIYLLYVLIQNVENKTIVIIPMAVSLLAMHVFYLYKNSKMIKFRKKKTGKKWLFESTVLQMGGLIHFLNIGIYVPIFFEINSQWTTPFTFIFSVFLVIYYLAIYISIYIVTPKLKETLSNEHPEYRLIK
jgi:cadmium resistance protein CadD (predicted permease)